MLRQQFCMLPLCRKALNQEPSCFKSSRDGLFDVFHQLPNQVYPQIRIDGARSGYRWQTIFPIPVIILVFYNEIGGNSSHTGCIGEIRYRLRMILFQIKCLFQHLPVRFRPFQLISLFSGYVSLSLQLIDDWIVVDFFIPTTWQALSIDTTYSLQALSEWMTI